MNFALERKYRTYDGVILAAHSVSRAADDTDWGAIQTKDNICTLGNDAQKAQKSDSLRRTGLIKMLIEGRFWDNAYFLGSGAALNRTCGTSAGGPTSWLRNVESMLRSATLKLTAVSVTVTVVVLVAEVVGVFHGMATARVEKTQRV